MPREVQEAFVRTIPGLENVEFLVYGYAVEYDMIWPSQIRSTLEVKTVSGLFLAGFLDASGKLDRSGRCLAVEANGRRASYTVARADETRDGKPVRVSETDIDNLMRAKAAIFSAASLMLKQVGFSFNDLSVFHVAGGFGKHLDLGHAIAIGLLPDIPLERFRYLGNASLAGTKLALLSKRHRMTYLDLSASPGYMDQYTAALFLPHTELHLFPSVSARARGAAGNGIDSR